MVKSTQKNQREPGELPVPETIGVAPLAIDVRAGEPDAASIKPPESKREEPDDLIEAQWKFAEETHKYIREYIRQADQKATFFFAGSTALIAFLYKANLIRIWLKEPTHWIFIDLLSFLATVGLFVCSIACASTILPRLRGSKRGIIFFSAISDCQSSDDYVGCVTKNTLGELVSAKLSHIHDLAKICDTKFSVLRIGLWAGAIGVFATVLLLIFSKNIPC